MPKYENITTEAQAKFSHPMPAGVVDENGCGPASWPAPTYSPQWQPIETAPKDGLVKLGFCPIGDDFWIGSMWWNDDDLEWLTDGIPRALVLVDGEPTDTSICEQAKPTHWMPLPLPPRNL